MSEENKTAEQIVDYIRSMPILSNKETYQSAVEMVKNYAITQQQSANDELKQELSDRDTAFILSKNTAKRRGEKIKELNEQIDFLLSDHQMHINVMNENAELKKQNAELVDDLNLKIQDLNRQIPRYNDIAEGHRFQGKIELYQDAKTTAIVYSQIANQLKELISKHTT